MARFVLLSLKEGTLNFNFDDVVVSQTCITREGKPYGEQMSALLAGAAS